jgi:triacylglycerol esterase/lipase EstA (alpha/beta hydrolase family)
MFNNLFLIHGAWASRHTFNYITSNISTTGTVQHFEYDCQTEDPHDIIRRADRELRELNKNGKKTTIIGHSLGGILATYLHKRASNVVTLAAPLRGVDSLNYLMHYLLVFYAPVFKHLTPKSKFITDMHADDYTGTRFDICVATSGYNIAMPHKPSDGTISIESQIAWTPDEARIHNIKATHHEVVQHPHAISVIKSTI